MRCARTRRYREDGREGLEESYGVDRGSRRRERRGREREEGCLDVFGRRQFMECLNDGVGIAGWRMVGVGGARDKGSNSSR